MLWDEAEERSETVQCRMFLWRAPIMRVCGWVYYCRLHLGRQTLVLRFFALYNLDLEDGRRGRDGHDVQDDA